ncbi:hypothetical protein COCCU_11055 [Corynebacterium occultum]|uniref:Uncharacterized protein n=2 Tax=Corynebacterium occultum TaxID=2675219 RepID=A0A6B8WA31_9CORY|nr:hypothetical protein COCCU_06905 [Corynebacterium occultum]QGU08125.1 hypothetical protein COCCU_11055 [Corynebacterium occultum]
MQGGVLGGGGGFEDGVDVQGVIGGEHRLDLGVSGAGGAEVDAQGSWVGVVFGGRGVEFGEEVA